MTHGAHDPKMAILGLEPPRRKIWALYSKHNITDGHRQFWVQNAQSAQKYEWRKRVRWLVWW